MSNRITLSYTIEMENLEDEVARLYSNVVDSMSKTMSRLKKPDALLTIEAYNSIDAFRRQLADFDAKLQDINLIINSYVAHQVEVNKQNHIAVAPQDEDTA